MGVNLGGFLFVSLQWGVRGIVLSAYALYNVYKNPEVLCGCACECVCICLAIKLVFWKLVNSFFSFPPEVFVTKCVNKSST